MADKVTKADAILALLSDGLRKELIATFNAINQNYIEHRWEPSELNGGKFCEVVYTILKGHTDGDMYPSKSKGPSNMLSACQEFEKIPKSSFPRSVRIQIPRMLIVLYEFRNNRGVGHAGGDVDPNHMDATAVLYMSKWVMAELVRLFHDVDTQTATKTVDMLVERILPLVWQVNGKYRVLDASRSMLQKTLLILYQQNKPVDESVLISWVEHTNSTVYRQDILRKAHKNKLIEYDSDKKTVQILPPGIKFIDELLFRR